MFCESYRNALNEAAVNGEALPREAEAHLAACAACRAAFAEERAVLAAVDSGLLRIANQDVPSTLVPRVGAAIRENAAPRPSAISWDFAIAMTAVALALAAGVFALHREKFRTNEAMKPGQGSVVVRSKIENDVENQGGNGSHKAPSSTLSAAGMRTVHGVGEPRLTAFVSYSPEVLVPSEERIAMERYLHARPQASAAIIVAPKSPEEAVSIAPIQIAAMNPVLPGEDGVQRTDLR